MQRRCSLAKISGKKCNFLPERVSRSLPIQIRHIKILRLGSRQSGLRFGMHNMQCIVKSLVKDNDFIHR